MKRFRVRINKTAPPAPVISSGTHAEGEWVSDNDPSFEWTEPSDPCGIAGYSYELDETPTTVPDDTSEGTDRFRSYTDVADGIRYFHVRAQDGSGIWGDADHYQIRVDTTPPETTAALDGTLCDDNVYSSDVTVTLTATDGGSGVRVTKYRLDPADPWQRYTVPFIVTSTTMVY